MRIKRYRLIAYKEDMVPIYLNEGYSYISLKEARQDAIAFVKLKYNVVEIYCGTVFVSRYICERKAVKAE